VSIKKLLGLDTGNEAEDQMAQVPLFCCGVPLLAVVIAAVVALVVLL
jgi:hypothetical protein